MKYLETEWRRAMIGGRSRERLDDGRELSVGWNVVLKLMRGYLAGDEMREDASACATLGLDGMRVPQEKGSTETSETGAERAIGRAVNVRIC